MKDRTIIKKTQNQIRELTAKKAQQLEVIEKELLNKREEIAAADEAAKAAAEVMDLVAWNRAQEAKKSAEVAEKMYSSRLSQLSAMEMISEEESDRVIDSLRAYARDADAEFDTSMKKILVDLRALLAAYSADIQEVESVILNWTNNVHKFYRSPGSSYFDPKTGTRSDRAPFPVPALPPHGLFGGHARMVRQFLSNFESLLDDPEDEADE